MADEFLRVERVDGRRFAMMNPGAGWPSKIWPAERYGELARRLAKTHGLASVAVWGVPQRVAAGGTDRRHQRRPRAIGAADVDDGAGGACAGGRRCSSAPTRGRCIWRWRSARRRSACTGRAGPSGAGPTARRTSACRFATKRVRRSSAARPTTRRCGRSASTWWHDACDRLLRSQQPARQCG